MTDEEQHCYEALAALREDYERAAKPYVARLVAIENCRPSRNLDQPGGKVGPHHFACDGKGIRSTPAGAARLINPSWLAWLNVKNIGRGGRQFSIATSRAT